MEILGFENEFDREKLYSILQEVWKTNGGGSGIRSVLIFIDRK